MDNLHSTLVAVHRCCLPWLQALLTLSHKYFSLFNRSTCALSVPCQYSGLQGIHLATSSCSQKQPYSWKGSTTRLTTLLNRQVIGTVTLVVCNSRHFKSIQHRVSCGHQTFRTLQGRPGQAVSSTAEKPYRLSLLLG